MAEVLKGQIEQLTSRLSNETDGDKAAQKLLSLLGLLKNGKSESINILAAVNELLQLTPGAPTSW